MSYARPLFYSSGSGGGAGPQGSTGHQGATGSKGSTGDTGPQGYPGSTGATGYQGSTGIRGVAGGNGGLPFYLNYSKVEDPDIIGNEFLDIFLPELLNKNQLSLLKNFIFSL